MSQGFDPAIPAFKSFDSSAEIRTQLNALNTAHSGPSAPALVSEGQAWLDTTNRAYKRYLLGGWRTIFTYDALGNISFPSIAGERGRCIDFYAGSNSPLVTYLDVFGVEDSAAFESHLNEDVVFNLKRPLTLYTSGFTIALIYVMSSSEAADVVLSLASIYHESGELYTDGTSYSDLQVVTPVGTQDTLAVMVPFSIPAGRVTVDTVDVEFRLMRVGSHIADTHTGDLGLKHIVVLPV